MTVYAIRPTDELAWLICRSLEEVTDTLSTYDSGWSFTIEIRDMSAEELDGLADFDGW